MSAKVVQPRPRQSSQLLLKLHMCDCRRYNPTKVPDARSMALSKGNNDGATLVYVGNRVGKTVTLYTALDPIKAQQHCGIIVYERMFG